MICASGFFTLASTDLITYKGFATAFSSADYSRSNRSRGIIFLFFWSRNRFCRCSGSYGTRYCRTWWIRFRCALSTWGEIDVWRWFRCLRFDLRLFICMCTFRTSLDPYISSGVSWYMYHTRRVPGVSWNRRSLIQACLHPGSMTKTSSLRGRSSNDTAINQNSRDLVRC